MRWMWATERGRPLPSNSPTSIIRVFLKCATGCDRPRHDRFSHPAPGGGAGGTTSEVQNCNTFYTLPSTYERCARSQFRSRFWPQFGPSSSHSSESVAITLPHHAERANAWTLQKIILLCHTVSSSLTCSVGKFPELRATGSNPVRRTSKQGTAAAHRYLPDTYPVGH